MVHGNLAFSVGAPSGHRDSAARSEGSHLRNRILQLIDWVYFCEFIELSGLFIGLDERRLSCQPSRSSIPPHPDYFCMGGESHEARQRRLDRESINYQ
jgi:hypothetical protein